MRRLGLLLAGIVVPLASAAASCGGGAKAHWVITDIGPGAAVDINESGQVAADGAFVWQDGKTTQLGTLGGRRSSVVAINDRSQVIGGSVTAKPVQGHGFIWQNGKMNDLGTLGGRRSSVRAINNRGQVVGDATTKNGLSHAFLWQNGKMRDLGTLGGPSSIAFAINERGQVVGEADTGAKNTHGGWISHAFLWQNGKMRDLGTLGGDYGAGSSAVDINEAGQVVGSSYSSTISYGQCGGGSHAFLWEKGKMRDLGTLGRKPRASAAVAINDRGWIIGNSPPTCDWRPFLWRNGKMVNLGTLPGGNHSSVVAINERGQVIGWSGTSGAHPVQHAFIWQNGRMTDLGLLNPKSSWSSAAAINEHDQIVGSSTTARGKGRAVLWTLARDT
jgi:probable HAF family extracellular repeat protein